MDEEKKLVEQEAEIGSEEAKEKKFGLFDVYSLLHD